MYLYHIAEKDIPEGYNLKRAQEGFDNTVVILQESTKNELIENIDLLCNIDLIKWVPFNRISEIIECFKEVNYKAKDLIIQQGTIGYKFFVVKQGVVEVFSDSATNFFLKRYQRGDYFGESAIISLEKRLANVKAVTDVTLLEIHKNDFIWIFDYNSKVTAKYEASPLLMIKKLQEIRSQQDSEFISE